MGEIMDKFEVLGELVEMLVKNFDSKALIIEGKHGIGKSFYIWRTLGARLGLRENVDYTYINGYSTPYALYKILLENRSKRIIILDDMDTAFIKRVVKQLLKGALDNITGQRIVRWASTRAPPDLPESFILDAKIIIIGNKFPKKDADWEAVKDRCFYYHFDLSYRERINLLKKLIEKNSVTNSVLLSKKENLKCLNLLASETNDLHLPTIRDFERLCSIYRHCKDNRHLYKFENLGREILKKDRTHTITGSTDSNFEDVDEEKNEMNGVLIEKPKV